MNNNSSVLSPPPPPSGFPPRRGLGTPPNDSNGSNGSNNSVNENANGNGNNDDNENPTIDYYKRREIEDEITSNLFEKVVFANMEEMMKCNFSPEEKKIVAESVQSTMYQGFVGGVSTLVLLRGYRAGFIGRILSSFKIKRRASASTTTTTVSNSTPLRYGFLLGFDVSLSCFVGCGIVLNSVFSQKLIQGMTKIPMLPGKTTISQSYCNSAIAEYQLMEKEYKSTNNRMALDVINNPQTVNLQGFYDLYQNCVLNENHMKP